MASKARGGGSAKETAKDFLIRRKPSNPLEPKTLALVRAGKAFGLNYDAA